MNPIYRFFILRPTANLLDPAMVARGYQLNVTNGKLVPSSGQTSDYMPVVPGTTYSTKQSSGIAMQISYIAFYDAGRAFVSGTTNVMSATAPAGAAYARVTFPGGLDLSEWQFADSSLDFCEFVSSQVFPVYKDDVAIDYALENGEEFYRGSLSGKFTFQAADYDYINEAAFDNRFDFKICITYDGGANWADYWRGKFYKTDCEFNDDDKTVIVTPQMDDRYKDVIAGLEKEYDLIKLAPEIQHINYDKRPMLQFYVPGTTTVGCYLRGIWWEQECEATNDISRLAAAQFYLTKDMTIAEFSQTGTPTIPRSMFITSPQGQWDDGYTLTGGDYELVISPLGGSSYGYYLRDTATHTPLWSATRSGTPAPVPSFDVQLSPVSGNGATGTVKVTLRLFQVFMRLVTDKDVVGSQEIPANDIVSDMRNYHYVVPENYPDAIVFSSDFSSAPTEYGLFEPGYYYARPDAYCLPLGRNWWSAFSLWVDSSQLPVSLDEDNRKSVVLRDAYPIAAVISALLGQFAPGITHKGTQDYSRFLYAETDPLTFVSHNLFITPKSNILTAGYDQPAQTAKITLRAVLDMLRDCFRCYWFIDEQDRFRIEHIEFFRNGGAYSILPSIGIDLTQEIVTRNGKPWTYARNQYKFDKPEMAERYQFGWMDDVTEQFEGQPIDIVSGYVQQGNIETISPSQFTSDVDYMLLNPGACSKDGFALLSATPTRMAYDLDLFAKLDRWINTTTGLWGTSTSYKHIAIPIVPGQRVRVVANSTNAAQIAWLTSDVVGSGGSTPPYAPNTTIMTQTAGTTEEYTAPDGAAFLYVYFGQGSAYATKPQNIYLYDGFVLPYENIAGGILQNGQLSWPYLQIYYVWDMPARYYKIGTTQYRATGVKKLKTQSLKFPVLREPNFYKLVKTELGNGTIQKLSVNLSSRNATATLKYDYDTE